MKFAKSAFLVAMIAVFLVGPRWVSAGQPALRTNCYILIGKPDLPVKGKPEVRIIPGTIIIPGTKSAQKESDSLESIIRELKETYRLKVLETGAVQTLFLSEQMNQTISPLVQGMKIDITLLSYDTAQAKFKMCLWENEKPIAEPVISVKRGDRGCAVIGGRNGHDAPYFFILIQPASEQEMKTAGSKISTPHLIQRVEPLYPVDAAAEKIQGIVLLDCTTGVDGSVKDVKVLQSPDPRLADTAQKAVSQWRYEPARDADGRAVEVEFTLTICFTLREDEPPEQKK